MSLVGYLPPVVAEVVGEIGKYSTAMGEVKREMGTLEASTKRFAAAGKVAMAGLALGAAGVAFESVKLASAFDQTMELVHTQAGASQAEVDGLKNSVLALGPATGQGPEALAAGLYHIESTGYRGKAALDILEASARLASMGLADLDTVTFAMSGTMSSGMKDIKNAADATNYLNTIVGMGDMKMQSLAAAIGTGVLPSFKSAGLGMTDFGAALATITDNSTPADEAATRLRMTISLMAAPSGKAVEALNSIGLSGTSLAEDMRKPNGLLVAVMDLKTHLEKSGKSAVEQNQIIEHAFGGGKTSGAILTLLDETDRLKSKYEALGTTTSRAKTANEAWAKQQKQFSQQVHELVAQLQAWGVKIGSWLIPKLEGAATWIAKHKGLVKDLAIAISGPLLLAIGAWVVAMGQAAVANIAATWEILLIVAAVAALGYGIYELVTHWNTVWGWIKKTAGEAWHWMYQHVWVDGLYAAYAQTKAGLKDLGDKWSIGWTAAGKALKWVYDHTIGPIIKAIRDSIGDVQTALNVLSGTTIKGGGKGLGQIAGKVHGYADGGTVPGPRGAPQLAVVHGGEQILSNDEISSMSRRPGGGGSSAGGGDIVIHQTIVTPDGKRLRTEQLRYARRAGLKPNQLYPANTGSLVRA